jgi:hypothetical protein
MRRETRHAIISCDHEDGDDDPPYSAYQPPADRGEPT